jgi:hypothetical protein
VRECRAVQCNEVKILDLESVKRIPGGLCEMAASLGVQLEQLVSCEIFVSR